MPLLAVIAFVCFLLAPFWHAPGPWSMNQLGWVFVAAHLAFTGLGYPLVVPVRRRSREHV